MLILNKINKKIKFQKIFITKPWFIITKLKLILYTKWIKYNPINIRKIKKFYSNKVNLFKIEKKIQLDQKFFVKDEPFIEISKRSLFLKNKKYN